LLLQAAMRWIYSAAASAAILMSCLIVLSEAHEFVCVKRRCTNFRDKRIPIKKVSLPTFFCVEYFHAGYGRYPPSRVLLVFLPWLPWSFQGSCHQVRRFTSDGCGREIISVRYVICGHFGSVD